jgi:drug/metabolite transporter (DMT)-like permease
VTRSPQSLRVHVALFTVATLFSLNYIFSKIVMRTVSPVAYAWIRVAGASVLFALLGRRSTRAFDRRDWREIFTFAILGIVINGILFMAGLALTTAQVAAILITAIPVFALAIAIFLGRERATVAKIGGIALALVGALLVVGGEGFTGDAKTALGALMIVLNCLSYAAYLVLSKPLLTRHSTTAIMARMFVTGTILMLPIAAVPLMRQNWRAIPGATWMTLAIVIIGPTAGAYLLNAWALRHADSSLVAAYTYVQPVMATILAAMFLGERMRAVIVVAALMIFAGVWLAGRGAQPGPIPE